jgi:UDP-GlcNAc:undecaprenyl-phosphate GlcNAc-1-phosphate transferase
VFWLLACTANAALVTSAVLTWTVRRLARAHGWTAGPASGRHIHKFPIPRLGGVAIFFSFVVTISITSWNSGVISALPIVIPAAWMFAVGLVDDLVGVAASRKLAAQLVGAVLLFAVGFRIPLPLAFGALASALSFAITVTWTVLVMNAINLIDGLDGLASGASSCAAGAILLAAVRFQSFETALLSATLIGAVLGFCKFNLHPATIFLGDSGSLVIGTIIAAISIRLMQVTPWGFLVSLLALAHPLSEVCLSTFRRAITAKPVFRPDRRHFHHRLLDRPLSHRQSSFVLLSISVVFGCLALMAAAGGLLAVISVVLGAACANYGFRALRYRELTYLATLKRKITTHRFAIDAHVQLHELSVNLEETRSMAELRRLIVPTFSGLGFAHAILETAELEGDRTGIIGAHGMELLFPLTSRRGNIGVLRLGWDLAAPPPLDFDTFRSEFLPPLARTVSAHLLRYSEMETIPPSRKSGLVLVPAMLPERSGKSLGWEPMN